MQVYLVVNRSNGKAYAGQTKLTAGKRFVKHCNQAARGSKFHFHNAIRKHGKDAFSIVTVWQGDDSAKAKQIERNLIVGMRLNDRIFGYNMTEGGDGFKGAVWTSERRAAQAERMRTQGLGGWNKGTKMPEVAAKLRGNAHWPKGKSRPSWTPERRAAQAERARAQVATGHKGFGKVSTKSL